MKAIIKESKSRGFVYKDMPVPKPGLRDVLIKVKACAICGSDLNFYVWNKVFCDALVKDLPFIPGHEFSGEVVETGAAVEYIKPGDRVSVDTHIPCGHCRQCQIGRPHTCLDMGLFGHNMNGCFAEYTVAKESAVRKIPTGLNWEQGAMLEPLGVVMRPVLNSDIGMSTICVTGCGPIGQFAVSFANALGAYRIYAVDINPKRLHLAREMGATDIIDASKYPDFSRIVLNDSKDGIDVFLEASGSTDAINEGLRSLRYGGTMYMIGQPKKSLVIDDPMRMLTLKEVTIKGTWGRELFKSWEKAENFILSGKIDINKIITHRFSFNEYEQAFETAYVRQLL